jgi:tetratricopeptide (TPR) repeat protein
MSRFLPSLGFLYLIILAASITYGVFWFIRPTATEYRSMGNMQVAIGDYPAAVESFEKAIRYFDLDKDKAQTFRSLAGAYFAARDYQAAFSSWLRVAELEPADKQDKNAIKRLIMTMKDREPGLTVGFRQTLDEFEHLNQGLRSDIESLLGQE